MLGCSLTLYDEADFTGESFTCSNGSVNDNPFCTMHDGTDHSFNNKASSFSCTCNCAILYDKYGPDHPTWDPSDDSQKIHVNVGSQALTGSGLNNLLSRFDVMPGRVLKDYSFITLD